MDLGPAAGHVPGFRRRPLTRGLDLSGTVRAGAEPLGSGHAVTGTERLAESVTPGYVRGHYPYGTPYSV
ncbi:hypothetical protein [Streptomyces griseoloalbus]|uniref:Uncharacterized protein n=1 Tax=Streptomyces griseoloalbus TaxID=67303 RepID=A0A7W8BIY5_9ACTN|nr:hypothetical protein [Streptomyces albaduncus]MBB5124210.1 hypothetical protein [Streptomyces albaduncus]GGW33333.1 hypothetical protein GCM10010340_08920 [Streptomyces albaduncus]